MYGPISDPRFNQPSVSTTPTPLNLLNSTSVSNALDQETTKLQNEADGLKVEISNTDFTQIGVLKPLIDKIAFFSGQVSVIGGGTWGMLHSVEDALIAKIKAVGPSAFTNDERSYITTWVNGVMNGRQDHPDHTSQILPGFNSQTHSNCRPNNRKSKFLDFGIKFFSKIEYSNFKIKTATMEPKPQLTIIEAIAPIHYVYT